MKQKEVIIIVPGTKGLCKWPKIVQKIFIFLSKIFSFDPVFLDHEKIWKEKADFKNKKIIWMHWSRGIGPISKFFAKIRLKRLLHHYLNLLSRNCFLSRN